MLKRRRILLAVLWISLNITVAFAEDVLVSGKEAQVSKQMFLSALDRLDENTREQLLTQEAQVFRAVKNYYMTAVALDRAKKSGLYDSPQMQAKIEKAIGDTVIREMHKDYVEKSMAKKDFESLAKDYYTGNKEKYKRPAEVDASHILINAKERTQEDARALAEQIRDRLLAGEDFAALAAEYSDDPSAASNAGRLGFFSRKKMVRPFSMAAFALKKPGDISPVVKSQFGYHVIRLEAIKADDYFPFKDVKAGLIKKLKSNEKDRLGRIFKIELLDAENIEINHQAISSMVLRK